MCACACACCARGSVKQSPTREMWPHPAITRGFAAFRARFVVDININLFCVNVVLFPFFFECFSSVFRVSIGRHFRIIQTEKCFK